MRIGIPTEIKVHEYRVSLSPQGVRELVSHGHQIIVQSGAGKAIGFEDEDYHDVGALIAKNAEETYAEAELIVKVKEPQLSECALLNDRHSIFSYLHLAAEPEMTVKLMESGCTAIAFETVTDHKGRLPLLAPMSEVAGAMAVQAGIHCLEIRNGGRGVLVSGVPGVAPGKVVIIGGGVVGTASAKIAAGMGADVTILDKSLDRIRELDNLFGNNVRNIYASKEAIERYVIDADLVVGAVLIPGAAAPKLVTADMVKQMHRGAVIADVAIDQGGCMETSKPTTHENPTYVIDGVVHYCVTNIPGAVARTSSHALENAILPYIIQLADNGYRTALRENEHFRNGLNVCQGRITHEMVARDLNHSFTPPTMILGERA